MGAIEKLLRTITIGLDGFIYPLIPVLYNVFYDLATGKLFSNEMISTITGNIYILVSVAMLFAFGAELIKAIINPDLLLDSKKGTAAIIKRMIIAIVLITAIPMLFSNLQIVQKAVLDNSLIEKLILGANPNDTDKKGNSITNKAGQYLAGATLGAVVYPNKDATTDEEGLETLYNDMINSNIGLIYSFGDYINEQYEKDGEKAPVFEFQKLVSIVAGFFILYMLVLACFDMGLRLVKLAFLEITAPVSIIAYIIQGNSALQKWFNEVMSTFAGVFVKIVSLSFIVVGLTQLENITIDSKSTGWLVKIFVVCGLLMFIKLIPQLIQSLFGINIDSKGGIKGRLAGMAAVGGIAANAWGNISKHPFKSASKPIGMVAGVGTNVAARVKNGKGVRGKLLGAGAGVITSVGAARRGWNNGIRAMGRENTYYKNTHPKDSTFTGRVGGRIRDTFGFDQKVEGMDRRLNKMEYVYTPPDGGPEVRWTTQQFEAERRRLQNEVARQNEIVNQNNNLINSNNETIGRNDNVKSYVQEARDRAKTLATTSNSGITKTQEVDIGNGKKVTLSGNLNNWANTIEALKNAAPKRENGVSDEEYNNALAEHSRMITKLQQAYDKQVKTATNATIEKALRDTNGDSIIKTAIQNANTALKYTSLAGQKITADNIMRNYQKDIDLGNGEIVKLSGTLDDWKNKINEVMQQAPVMANFATQASYEQALSQYNMKMDKLKQAYNAQAQIDSSSGFDLGKIVKQLNTMNNDLNNKNVDLNLKNQDVNVTMQNYNTELNRLSVAEEARNRAIEEEKASKKYKSAEANKKSDEYRRNNNKNS